MSVHLVRHADAGDRSSWDGADELRPLNRKGRAQATALSDLLAPTGIQRVLSSRYVRCAETVEPLAEALGLKVEEHEALAEEADIADTWSLVEELAGTEAAVCTHGNLIGSLLDRLHRRGVELIADRWECKKASVWTIDFAPDGTVARARYTPRPRPASR